jgi:hypothetical protein
MPESVQVACDSETDYRFLKAILANCWPDNLEKRYFDLRPIVDTTIFDRAVQCYYAEDRPMHNALADAQAYSLGWLAWTDAHSVGGGVNPRKSGGENACLHGSKRENAALTAMHQRIAPPPRQGCASPGCIRPQPALDPATGRFFIAHAQHFLCQKKTFRQIYADFDRHQHPQTGGGKKLRNKAV